MNEAETRAEHIDPALKAAGWGVAEGSRILREYPITLGRIEGHGKRGKPLTADYVLVYRNHKLGVIEANLAAAEALLNDTQKTLARVTPLTAAGAASRADLDAATAARDTALAQVHAIDKNATPKTACSSICVPHHLHAPTGERASERALSGRIVQVQQTRSIVLTR